MPRNPNPLEEVTLYEFNETEENEHKIGPMIRQFLELDDRHRDLKKQADEAREQLEEFKMELFQTMVDLGWSSLKVDGRTVYLHRQLWAKPAKSKFELHEALRACGYDELVYETTNANQVSAVIREIADQLTVENDGLPPSTEEIIASLPAPLRDTLEITERHDVRARKS